MIVFVKDRDLWPFIEKREWEERRIFFDQLFDFVGWADVLTGAGIWFEKESRRIQEEIER